MANMTVKLKISALKKIKASTSLKEIAYLVKSLKDNNAFGSTIASEVDKKIDELEDSSSARDIAFILKAVSDVYDVYDPKLYEIGEPGALGFGVATCLDENIPTGITPMLGHDIIIHENYGNYIDENGSILVHVPKHYYKFDGNELYISATEKVGYVLERSFINAGEEKTGVFIYKYGASNSNGIFTSKKFAKPLSTRGDHNPISELNGNPANNLGGLYSAAKTAGDNYYLMSVFNYKMLARLAYCHGKAATSTATCAYIDVEPKMPKGNLANSLRDVNDVSVNFDAEGYSNCALTGSGFPFSKTTHNGQDSGIADLNGNMWEVGSGFIRTDAAGFMVLKESVDITSILTDASTSGGAYDTSLYDVIDLSDLIDEANGWTYFGNGSEPVFGMSDDRTTDTFKRTSLGIPLSTGISASGTREFGNDGLYKHLRNEMACRCGGFWGDSSDAGAFAMVLSNSRAHSSYYVGGRACVFAL